MKQGEQPKTERRRTICGTCSLVQVRMVAATLSPEVFFGDCGKCGKPTMQRDVGGPIEPEVPTTPPKEVDLEELLGPGDRFLVGLGAETHEIDRATALAALESGEDGGSIRSLGGDGEPAMPGDPEVCPECGEAYQHDAGCPFPGRLHQAYLRWRETDDGKVVVDAIRTRALGLASKGWRHYGIQALAEVARYDRALDVGPDAEGYRVNNSHLSRLARDLMREDPDGPLRDFFEVRELRSIR